MECAHVLQPRTELTTESHDQQLSLLRLLSKTDYERLDQGASASGSLPILEAVITGNADWDRFEETRHDFFERNELSLSESTARDVLISGVDSAAVEAWADCMRRHHTGINLFARDIQSKSFVAHLVVNLGHLDKANLVLQVQGGKFETERRFLKRGGAFYRREIRARSIISVLVTRSDNHPVTTIASIDRNHTSFSDSMVVTVAPRLGGTDALSTTIREIFNAGEYRHGKPARKGEAEPVKIMLTNYGPGNVKHSDGWYNTGTRELPPGKSVVLDLGALNASSDTADTTCTVLGLEPR